MPQNTQRNARRNTQRITKQNGGFRARDPVRYYEQTTPRNHLKPRFANSPPTIRVNKKPRSNNKNNTRRRR